MIENRINLHVSSHRRQSFDREIMNNVLPVSGNTSDHFLQRLYSLADMKDLCMQRIRYGASHENDQTSAEQKNATDCQEVDVYPFQLSSEENAFGFLSCEAK